MLLNLDLSDVSSQLDQVIYFGKEYTVNNAWF